MPDVPISRRRFLGRAMAVAAAPALAVVPRRVLGGPGHTAPSDVLGRATIGTGAQGLEHVLAPAERATAVQRAVCDVDRRHLACAVERAGPGCKAYRDFREVLDRPGVDVVYVATPPHWHALITLAAVRAGKDVFCEKPMTRFIREGRAVARAAAEYGRIVMHNTLGRGGPWRTLRQLVASGLLGTPLRVHVGPATGFGFKVRTWTGLRNQAPKAAPPHLDYDLWLGPAPEKPYHPHRVHGTFRGYWDYDGGGLTDMGQHWLDPVQYVLGKDDTGPVRVEAQAPWPAHPDACGPWGRIVLTYADATAITLESGEWGEATPPPVPFIEGPGGRVFHDLTRGHFTTEPDGLLGAGGAWSEPPEMVDFETAVRTRSRAPGEKPGAEEAHRSTTLLHLGNIAIRTGRTIAWEPVAEEIVGDAEAGRLVDVPMRAPWHL